MKKISRKNLITLFIIIMAIIVLFLCGLIIKRIIKEIKFTKDNIEVYEKNIEDVFDIKKILICSSANAIDNSEEKNLQDLSIYQLTDIAVYIENGEELTNKNTIKQMYIDNISFIGNNSIGHKSLNYRNILKFGLNEEKDEFNNTETDRIDFNIINTNAENDEANYDEPNFYTDCSNPITLQYVNSNIVTGYKMDENNQISFNGNILNSVGINIEDINCEIIFKINIINNENEKYSCWVNFKLLLNDLYKGTLTKVKTTIGTKYKFFQE